jgi:hypothetical protein
MEGNLKMSEYVLVRGDRSGVSVGKLKQENDRTVILDECIRIWYWDGASSIMQLAVDGTAKPDNCKFSVQTNNHKILDAIEILPLTTKAKESIYGVKAWRI